MSNSSSRWYVDGAEGKALVASVVSENYVKMVNAMNAAGISGGHVTASSSWRTNTYQHYLWDSLHNSQSVASAGYSNHQSGLAIDFDVPTGSLNITSCRTTSLSWSSVTDHASQNRWKTSPMSQWFCENIDKYGLKREVRDEPWHVSPSGK